MDKESVATACLGFFDLPREIRDNILGHLFTTSTCSQWTSNYGVLDVSSDVWPSFRLTQPEYIRSSQFSTEAAQAFYRSSNFEIYIGDVANFFSYKRHPTGYGEAPLSDKQSLLNNFDMKPFVESVIIIATGQPFWRLGDMAKAQEVIKELRKIFGKVLELRQEFHAGYGDEQADDITWMWETESKEAKSWIMKLGYGPKLSMQRDIAMDWIISEGYGGNETAFHDDWKSGVSFQRQWL